MNYPKFLEKLLGGTDVEWRALGSLGELIRGNGLQKKDFTEMGVPAIHYGQIYTHYGISTTKTKSFVSPELARQLRKVDKGDVVITNTSENLEDVGKALVYLGEEQAVTGGHATVLKPGNCLLGKYFAYFAQTSKFSGEKSKYAKGAKVIDISATDMAKISIPIPCPDNPSKSLEVQGEIVRILDSFAELTANLTAELIARRKQYIHYRDRLLSFEEGGVELKPLGRIAASVASGRNKARSTAGAVPVYGSTGQIGFTTHAAYSGDVLLVARVGANAGLVNAVSGDFDVSDNTLIVRPAENWNIRFAFHQLTHMNLNQYAVGGGQPLVTGGLLKGLKVPVPGLREQERIAGILDKFDALTNSLTGGLPREIELRQRQYAHYRELLFSFPKPEEVAA